MSAGNAKQNRKLRKASTHNLPASFSQRINSVCSILFPRYEFQLNSILLFFHALTVDDPRFGMDAKLGRGQQNDRPYAPHVFCRHAYPARTYVFRNGQALQWLFLRSAGEIG